MRNKSRHRRLRHHFLVAAMRAPLKIGGFLPSSRALARAMADGVDIHKPGVIIELGAGTGVVTHALLKAGISPDKLIVIERDENLHGVMSSQFPHLNILCADAIELQKVLAEQGVKQVNAIVSSLPFLTMPKHVRHAIQEAMAAVLGDEGKIVQFTYGPKSPISIHELRKYHLHGKRMKLILQNMPPAHIWHYHKVS